jgi:hypothetical protein
VVIPVSAWAQGNWAYLCGAVGSLATFALLFQPWLRSGGWDGTAHSNAFGSIDVVSYDINIWSSERPPLAQLSGVWAILITVAVVLCLFAVAANIRRPSQTLATAAAASTVAIAVLVVIELIYLNGKETEFKAMLGFRGDMASQIGMLVRGLTHQGTYPLPGTPKAFATAQLTPWAIIACVISLISAAVTARHWYRGRTAAPGHAQIE